MKTTTRNGEKQQETEQHIKLEQEELWITEEQEEGDIIDVSMSSYKWCRSASNLSAGGKSRI